MLSIGADIQLEQTWSRAFIARSLLPTNSLSPVIPGRGISAFTRVFDALSANPESRNGFGICILISGYRHGPAPEIKRK